MEKILVLVHLDETGSALPKAAYEAIGAALELPCESLTVGIVGDNIQTAADSIAGALAASTQSPQVSVQQKDANLGHRILAVSGPEFTQPRYSSDSAAAEALCRAVGATIVIAPSTSRFSRVIAGVAHRLNGAAETHITSINKDFSVTRWFYRQRIEAALARNTRPWFLLLDPGTHAAWQGNPVAANVETISVSVPATRTTVTGIRTPKQGQQTIRPDAKLLFVAGAGWTKKQADGQTHVADAETIIKGFLTESGASLGSSKSLVDQGSENQAVLTFLTHLNQVGQTGSTPRHPKGLSTCCHGEEPHVVGWRFINERRAINLDANCGWARGKADVLYVANAFEVMKKLSAILKEK